MTDELNTALGSIGVGGTAMIIIVAVWKIVSGWNHTHVRSNCCGKEMEVGIDVETGEPKEEIKDERK